MPGRASILRAVESPPSSARDSDPACVFSPPAREISAGTSRVSLFRGEVPDLRREVPGAASRVPDDANGERRRAQRRSCWRIARFSSRTPGFRWRTPGFSWNQRCFRCPLGWRQLERRSAIRIRGSAVRFSRRLQEKRGMRRPVRGSARQDSAWLQGDSARLRQDLRWAGEKSPRRNR